MVSDEKCLLVSNPDVCLDGVTSFSDYWTNSIIFFSFGSSMWMSTVPARIVLDVIVSLSDSMISYYSDVAKRQLEKDIPAQWFGDSTAAKQEATMANYDSNDMMFLTLVWLKKTLCATSLKCNASTTSTVCRVWTSTESTRLARMFASQVAWYKMTTIYPVLLMVIPSPRCWRSISRKLSS